MRNFRRVSADTAVEVFKLWTAMQSPWDREAGPFGGRTLIEAPERLTATPRPRSAPLPIQVERKARPAAAPRPDNVDEDVAAKIVRLRRQYGLTHEVLAERFGLSEATIARVIARAGT